MVERDEVALSPFSPVQDGTTNATGCSDSSNDEIWDEVVWEWNETGRDESEGCLTMKAVCDIILIVDNVDPNLICSLCGVAGIRPSCDKFVGTGRG